MVVVPLAHAFRGAVWSTGTASRPAAAARPYEGLAWQDTAGVTYGEKELRGLFEWLVG